MEIFKLKKIFFRRQRRLKTRCLITLVICLCFVIGSNLGTFYLWGNDIDLSNNYLDLRSSMEEAAEDFVIKNDKCRVPNVDEWSPEARILFKTNSPSTPKCNKSVKITYIEDNMVLINESEIQKLGYEPQDITCCYKTIVRVTQGKNNYTKDADNLYRYSEQCHKLENGSGSTLNSGFIRVSCKRQTWLPMPSWWTTVYEQYHALAMFPEDGVSESLLQKTLSFWEKKRKEVGFTMPPSVLVIGIDSTSRLNFNRLMKKTLAILGDVIGAEEMKGYTKVGQNTLPNFAAFLTSLSIDELRQICFSSTAPQDDCPYIWKEFSANEYLTAHLEDLPMGANFNHRRTGFLHSPVDIYLRPFMVAAYEHYGKPSTAAVDCLGYQRPEEIVLDFIDGLTLQANQRKIPYFITTWLSDLTHDDMFSVQNLDHKLSETLLKLHKRKALENTILFVMSDHGYRYLKIRSTKTGWYEDKMPALWIKVPPAVHSIYPKWTESLKKNSRQLITPFDLNYALRDILKSFSVHGLIPKPNLFVETPKLRAISPFQRIPDRTCMEAGVEAGFCPCVSPVAYGNEDFIRRASHYFISTLNSRLPDFCAPLRVKVVTAFGTLDKSFINNFDDTSRVYPEKSVMAVETSPGNFLYEVWLNYDKSNGQFTSTVSVFRTNGYDGSGNCATTSDPFDETELYCYCKKQ